MIPIIQAWLKNSVGVVVEVDDFKNVLRDGMLLIRILKFYDSINFSSLKNIFPSDDRKVCRRNLTQLKIWFLLIDIEFTNEIINEIVEGNLSTCVKLLYQLYLIFMRGAIRLPTKLKERYLKNQNLERYKVSRPLFKKVERSASSVYKYSYNILKYKRIIQWYEEKYKYESIETPPDVPAQLTVDKKDNSKLSFEDSKPYQNHSVKSPLSATYENDDINYVRHMLDKTGKSNTPNDILKRVECIEVNFENHIDKSRRYDSIDNLLSYNNNQRDILPSNSRQPVCELQNLPSEVKRYLHGLKHNTRVLSKRPSVRSYCCSVIEAAWTSFLDYEKNDLKEMFTKKLLKFSLYEKDMISKLTSMKLFYGLQKTCYADLESKVVRYRKSAVSMFTSDADESFDNEYAKEKNNDDDGDCDDNDDNDNNNNDIFFFDSVKHTYIFDDYDTYWLNEKKRTIDLHRKLYAEKLKLQFERHYAICFQTLRDIIDLSIKQSEFRTDNNVEVPYYIWDDWKYLFKHEQQIFDVVDDFSELLFPVEPNDLDMLQEKDRQDLLNENYVDTYLDLTGNWLNIIGDLEDKIYKINHDNQIILGHIVHKALETKYPLPPLRKPADIPSYPVTAIINGLDVEILNACKDQLEKAELLVVDVHTAVNFCLECYKNLFGYNFDNRSEVEIKNEFESDFISYFTEDFTFEEDGNNKFKTKFAQTTSSLFDTNDTMSLEVAARLGRDLFRTMLSGNEIAVSLLVDAIIQYIKLHHSAKLRGWVLVNFPSTLYQASVLERTLSGKNFPFNLEDDIISATGSECRGSVIGNAFADSSNFNIEMEVKNSRIVPNPEKYVGDGIFKSHFKLYITTTKGVPQQNCTVVEDTAFDSSNDSDTGSTKLLEQPEKEGIPSLHQFYEEQGINLDLLYDTFDSNAIKQLVHIVLLPFYSDANKVQKSLDEMEGVESPNTYNGIASSLLLDETGLLILNQERRVSSVFVDDQEILSLVNLEHNVSASRMEDISRVFANYPVQDSAMIALASFWEALETVYINGLKELFFLKRNTSYRVIPYLVFVTAEMNKFLNREDDRQTILSKFLYNFNNIHNVLRSDLELKNELHLQVFELKNRLTKLCTVKRNEVEQMRKTIIHQNWSYQDFMFYTNISLRLSQLEINRFLATLEFTRDYYLAMLNNYNSQPLPRFVISKVNMYTNENNAEIINRSIGFSVLGNVSLSEELNLEHNALYLTVINKFLNYDKMKDTNCPFYDLVDNKLNKTFEEIMAVASQVQKLIDSEEAAALKTHKDYVASKYNVAKKVDKSAHKNKQTASSTSTASKTNVLNEQDAAIKEAEEKRIDEENETLLRNLFQEWRETVNYEIERLSFRFELIKRKTNQELNDIWELMSNKFLEFSSQLNERFNEEISCIEDLCYLFQTAIEEKVSINADLLFCQSEFYAIKKPVQRKMPPLKLPPTLEEVLSKESFTVSQLEYLKERLRNIAPTGILTIEVFSQLIQNIILYDLSLDDVKSVPSIWRELKPHELRILFRSMFGSYSIFEWREFLIYCLEIPFPVMEEIIDARLQFIQYDLNQKESVSYEDYMKTTLWFQRELPENPLQALHNILVKRFIFFLFSVDNKNVNYIELLLSFCKDIDPKIGFCKALALLSGHCVIVYKEDMYLEEILTDDIDTEFKVVNQILKEILNDVVSNAILSDKDELFVSIGQNQEDDLISSPDVSSSDSSMLMESMYHELFRKHQLCQWSSKMSGSLVMSLLCFAISVVYMPSYNFLNPDVFSAVQVCLSKAEDDDIYVPEFVDSFWMNLIFKEIHKFNDVSIRNLIKNLIQKRNE